jgi:hypothetical protein
MPASTCKMSQLHAASLSADHANDRQTSGKRIDMAKPVPDHLFGGRERWLGLASAVNPRLDEAAMSMPGESTASALSLPDFASQQGCAGALSS